MASVGCSSGEGALWAAHPLATHGPRPQWVCYGNNLCHPMGPRWRLYTGRGAKNKRNMEGHSPEVVPDILWSYRPTALWSWELKTPRGNFSKNAKNPLDNIVKHQ